MTTQAEAAHWRTLGYLLATLLGAASLVMVSLEKLKYAAISQSSLNQVGRGAIRPAELLGVLGPWDALLATATALALLALAWTEWRQRALSRLLWEASPTQHLVALALLLAWLGHSYLTPGLLLGGDTGTHIVRFMEVRRALLEGAFPHWTHEQYLGSPLLGFTGPLTYLAGGALDVLVGDAPTTAKLFLFLLHLAGGLACFALLRRLGAARPAALIGTLAFAGAFAHLHLFLYRGVFPQAFTILFLLLLFHAAEGLMRGIGNRATNFLVFACTTAGLVINHQPHALFAAAYLGLFGAMSVLTGRWRARDAGPLILAGICGGAMSLYAVLPLVMEASWVMIQPEGALFGLRLPSPQRLSQLVLWRNTRTTWGIDYWAYLGLPLIVLTVGGAALACRTRLAARTPAEQAGFCVLPCLLLGLFLYNPVVRDVMFLLLFAAILATAGLDRLSRTARANWLAVAALAVLADVSSTAIQPVARTDKHFLGAAGQYLEQTAPNERVLEMVQDREGTLSANIGPNAGPISYRAAVPRIAGHHNMAATQMHNYLAVIAKQAQTDLTTHGRLTAETTALLGALHVTRVICLGPDRMGCPANFTPAREEGPLGRVVPVASPGPVLFAPRLAALAPPDLTDKPMMWDEHFLPGIRSAQVARARTLLAEWLRLSALTPGTPTAAALPVRTMPTALPAPPEASGEAPRLLEYRTGPGSITLRLTAPRPGYAQLAHPWFPSMAARINGAPTQAVQGTLGHMILAIPAGDSRIEIQAETTPIRTITLGLTAAALLLTLLLACRLRRP